MIRYEKLDIPKLLAKYNVRNITSRGEEVQFSCPFPEHTRGDRNPSSSINKATGKYHCFSCGRSGTVANFLADIENVPLATAKNWLEQSVGSSLNKENSALKYVRSLFNKEKDVAPGEVILDERILTEFSVDWPRVFTADKPPRELRYAIKRGFTQETLTTYEVGWDKHSRRLTIPIRNLDGALVGIKGRAVDVNAKPKYKSIGDKKGVYYGFPTCKIHNYVWGIDTSGPYLIIVEGEFDAMWLRQNGFPGAVALGGSDLSDYQTKLIKKVAESVVVLADSDLAGDKMERQLTRNLLGFVPVRIADLIDGDPASTEPNTLKELIDKAPGALTSKVKQKTQGV